MSEDLYRSLLGSGKKQFRRKRKQRGVDFSGQTPPSKQDVNRGVWCRRCKVRHGYNGATGNRLIAQFEQRGKAWVINWICPKSGDVVGELWLTGKREEGIDED